jgi:hypothetical protein
MRNLMKRCRRVAFIPLLLVMGMFGSGCLLYSTAQGNAECCPTPGILDFTIHVGESNLLTAVWVNCGGVVLDCFAKTVMDGAPGDQVAATAAQDCLPGFPLPSYCGQGSLITAQNFRLAEQEYFGNHDCLGFKVLPCYPNVFNQSCAAYWYGPPGWYVQAPGQDGCS